MDSKEKVLVVGATGLLGSEIVRLLAESGRTVRAVARDGCDPPKRAALESHGVHVVHADLKHPGSIQDACRGVGTIISTASATISRQDGDSIQSVDRDGQLALIAEAERAGVGHFVFVSFAPTAIDFELQRVKRTVEERLRGGKIPYTILQPTHFFEVWLSPALGFDPARGTARVFGDGRAPYSWVSLRDVARFAVKASRGGPMAGLVLPLAGPDSLSQRDVIGMFEEHGGRPVAVEEVPAQALDSQRKSASNALEEAYAALMLSVANGQRVDARPQLDFLPGQLRTVRQFVNETLQSTQ
jgi:uncharacterized protein YbjT (DUF2867 family)